MKITLPKIMFFSLAFFNGFGWVWGGFWECFGRGFGIFLASLGPLLASFFGACILHVLQKESWRLLGLILVPF